jgi:PAS domain-containing protein
LQRKRSEEALREAYEMNRVYTEELHTSNEELRTQAEELKEVNEALNESEKRFRALVTASSEVLYRMSPDWSTMHQLQSRGFLSNTGKPSRTWLQEYIPLDDQPHVNAIINDSIRTKSVFELEHRVRRADGSLGWTLSRAVPLMDANGEIVEWFGAASDITERKEAEKTLKKARDNLEENVKERTAELEEAYNTVLESEIRLNDTQKIAHLGNFDWNPVTDEVCWSNEMYRIFRLDPLEFGATYDAFLNYVHPDDRDYVDNAFKEALSGKAYDIEFRIILANGEERIVNVMGRVTFGEKRTPVRVRGTLQELPSEKKQKRKFRHWRMLSNHQMMLL